MGTLVLQLRGVNAYVPSKDGKSLMVVMPNATRLGKSKRLNASDGTPLARHMPILWESREDKRGRRSFFDPRVFPASRLTFELHGASSALDLSAINVSASESWLKVDPKFRQEDPDEDIVAAQVLISAGQVAPSQGPDCRIRWSASNFSKESLATVVHGLTVVIGGVERLVVKATHFGEARSWLDLEKNVEYGDELELFVGNLCADDVLAWPRNARDGRARDEDFRWLYQLSRDPELAKAKEPDKLPVPEVNGGYIDRDAPPKQALRSAAAPGGGTGCQCNGCKDNG